MRLIFAIASLVAVTIALREARRPLLDVHPRDVQQFQAGKEYRYLLDTQISSGFATVSDQHAMTRIQAQILLQFQSERSVVMRMESYEMGTLNREVLQPEKVQPMQMFKSVQVDDKQLDLIKLPLQFDYADGIVENLHFHQDDKPWAKNIKRAVLNMLQSNLKQRTGLVELEPIEKEYKDRETDQVENIRMFTLPEMTLEGECQTGYTINRMTPENKYNRYSEDSTETTRMFNVTKSIDFKRCKKIADIRYGPKIELPCDKCNVEELEERKLDRTTIIRQVFVGTPEKFGIQKIEVISHYMFKMINAEEERPMRTIVASELNYMDAKEIRSSRQELRDLGTEEKLIYSIEWDSDEKRFYMYGDEEFPNNSPFRAVNNKINTIEKSIIRLVNLWNDKVQGIESEGTGIFTKIVEFTRMCTLEELKQVYEKVTRNNERITGNDMHKAEDILVDALSNAGTHNTIKFLVEKIKSKEIESTRAIRAITHLKGLPMPSEKHVELLVEMCNSHVVQQNGPLKQTCWLTTGAIIGELCDDEVTREDGFERNLPKPMCQRKQQQKFVETIMELYKSGENRYEKILALKSLGNAGLAESTQELEKIIRDIREDPMIRMQAIDSLRRLRAQMPHRIQRILLPVFQNVRERPEIRMAAISMILPTIPDKNMLDQIAYTLLKEPSRQVKSYVYSAMMHLSESPISIEKELAKHLKSLLKLAGITEENEQEFLRGSRFVRVPFYSQKNREGLLSEFESMVGPDNYLPKRLTASLDALFSGILEKNGLELRVSQENIENWYHKVYDSMVDSFSYDRQERESRPRRHQQRESSSEESQEQSDKIYTKLGVKKRSRDQFWSVDSDASQGIEPYGMFTFRYADVDYVVLPVEEELLPESVRRYITSGKKPTMRDVEDLTKLFQGRPFRYQAAFNLLDSIVKVPTSAGFPIRMVHLLPVLASAEGNIKARLNGRNMEIESKLHPIMTATHLKRVEIWSPIVMTGAETTQTVELNWPIDSVIKIEADSKKSVSWFINIPQEKTQIFGLHTLPSTFVADIDRTSMLPRMPSIKKIDNQRLQQQFRSLDTVYGEESINLPLKVEGDVHIPHDVTSYKKVVNTLLTSENHVHAVFEPNHRTPKQIVLTVDGEAFRQHDDLTSHRQLRSFYSKNKFDEEYERQYGSSEEEGDNDRRLTSYLDDYEPRKMYKHQARVQLKTVMDRDSVHKFGEMSVEAACDERVKYCQGKLEIRRSPFMDEERGEWKFTAEAKTLYPEYVSDVDDLSRQDKKNMKFVAQIDAEWGTENADKKQQIDLRINGEQFKPKQWIQKISGIQRSTQDYESLEEQMKLKIAFLNKYDFVADYRLSPYTQNLFSRVFGGLKYWDFWSTSVQAQRNRDGVVSGTVMIDPITHEHVNMTVKTPSECVTIDSVKLPMKFKPFQLVRGSEGSSRSNSFMDVVRSYSSQNRPECKVDGKRVETFDDVTYKAPLTKCYSVLAKDCSSQTPRFTVLMKKLGSGEDKKLKLISGKQIIEVQPDKNGKLIVKVDGDEVTDTQELLDYGIDYTKEMVNIETRDVNVRFSGRKIWIKLAQTHKNTQCGLCGHYNDDAEDEFRMANNQHTSDLKEFHRGYTLEDEKCKKEMEESYGRERYERDDSDESRSWEDESNERGDEKKRPIEKTDVQEYNHKVCFSINSVKECPRGYRPDEKEDKKIKYLCFPRNDSEARRLLRESRRNPKNILDLPKNSNPSFTETIKVPKSCKSY